MKKMDSVTLTIINNHLVNACREMGVAMMRTSFSSIFNEGLDFSCVVFDRDGEMIASAEFCPAQMGAILYTVRWTIDELGIENFDPGDVVMHNDPYRAGCHLPEHMVLKPFFYQGELFGFAANIAHVTEIGGKAPGGFAADATDIYQEGLRIPPIKIIRRNEYVDDIWRIILANHRTPQVSWGDFHAMIGSLNIAERRLEELLDRYGFDDTLAAGKQLLDYSERRMRAEIREIPNGEYSFEDWVENDGVVLNKKYRIKCTIVVKDDEMIFDYTGSSPQARGPVNCTYGVTASATYNALLNITNSTIPRNSGCYRPVKMIIPPGTIVNVAEPAPSVGGNSEIHERIVDVLFGAFSMAVPKRIAAASGGSSLNFLFGGVHPQTQKYYTCYSLDGCGWGGKAESDGNHCQCPINGNCRNNPVEVFETYYPWLVKQYGLVPRSAGHGRHRGGCGVMKIMEVRAPEITISSFMDRHETGAWGLFGGTAGEPGALRIRRKGDDKWRTFCEVFGTKSPNKFAGIQLQEGDEVMLVSPGGGGYGSSLDRNPELLKEDVLDGFITQKTAQDVYGVVLKERDDGKLYVDREQTFSLRNRRQYENAEMGEN